MGLLIGTALAVPMVQVASPGGALVCQTVGSLFILVPALSVIAQKVACLTLVVSLNMAVERGLGGNEHVDPLKTLFAGLLGVVATLMAALLPLLRHKAQQDAEGLLASSEQTAAEATAMLCFTRSVGKEECTVLTVRAQSLLHKSEASRKRAQELVASAKWELACACTQRRRAPNKSIAQFSARRGSGSAARPDMSERLGQLAMIQHTAAEMLLCCQETQKGRRYQGHAQIPCPTTFEASHYFGHTAGADDGAQVQMVGKLWAHWRLKVATFDSMLAWPMRQLGDSLLSSEKTDLPRAAAHLRRALAQARKAAFYPDIESERHEISTCIALWGSLPHPFAPTHTYPPTNTNTHP